MIMLNDLIKHGGNRSLPENCHGNTEPSTIPVSHMMW